MAVNVTLCGTQYTIPSNGDTNAWGSALTAYLQALGVTPYYQSQTANAAASGIIRLAHADGIAWRGVTPAYDVTMYPGANDELFYGTGSGAAITGNPQSVYKTAAGQSIPTAAATIVNFDTQELDYAPGACVSTGAAWKFTVPANKAGLYAVEAGITWNAAIATAGTLVQLFKNGVLLRTLARTGSVSAGQMMAGACSVQLAVGDFLDVRVTQASGGAVALSSVSTDNFVCIHRQVT